MDDPILSAYLRDFSTSFNLSILKESDLFEYFSVYCVFFRDFSDNISLEDLVVAGMHDTAIDAVGIFLNDISVTAPVQVDDISSRQKIDVDFCFL